jgi:carboxypeptidase Taq
MTSESKAVAADTYDEFVDYVEQLGNLQHVTRILNWDQEVVMPEGGTPARSGQLSTVSAIKHDLLTDEKLADMLGELEDADLDEDQQAVVREVRRKHDRATSVPSDLVEEISRTASDAHPKWQQAREEDDFSAFAPSLEKLVELKREYAEHIDPDRDPYAVLFEEYEPYLGIDAAERVLTRLRDELQSLIEDIREVDADLATDAFEGTYNTTTQEELTRAVLDDLEYDWDRGRLDTAPHPFTSGNQFDSRITTRFNEEDPLGALMSTIHEFGHATYGLGLPDEHYATPLGESRDMTVHESQSRLWENHVGRSKAFWDRFLPTMKDSFPDLEPVTPQAAYEAANQVYEDNLIRVEADELTYHMHIVVRFEIERDLIRGDLEVEDVPEVWNDKMEEYLGIRPDTDAEGCLQDIHWSHGDFGYFPTYSLGSVLAAQLFATAEEEIEDLEGELRRGEVGPLHDWLTATIHQHGSRYTTDELIREATGEEYTAEYFLEYAEEKYGDLYDL